MEEGLLVQHITVARSGFCSRHIVQAALIPRSDPVDNLNTLFHLAGAASCTTEFPAKSKFVFHVNVHFLNGIYSMQCVNSLSMDCDTFTIDGWKSLVVVMKCRGTVYTLAEQPLGGPHDKNLPSAFLSQESLTKTSSDALGSARPVPLVGTELPSTPIQLYNPRHLGPTNAAPHTPLRVQMN